MCSEYNNAVFIENIKIIYFQWYIHFFLSLDWKEKKTLNENKILFLFSNHLFIFNAEHKECSSKSIKNCCNIWNITVQKFACLYYIYE